MLLPVLLLLVLLSAVVRVVLAVELVLEPWWYPAPVRVPSLGGVESSDADALLVVSRSVTGAAAVLKLASRSVTVLRADGRGMTEGALVYTTVCQRCTPGDYCMCTLFSPTEH